MSPRAYVCCFRIGLGIVAVAAALAATASPVLAQDGAFLRQPPPAQSPTGPQQLGEVAPVQPSTPQLEPIVLTPIIQYSTQNTAGGVIPIIQGQGEGTLWGTSSGNGLAGQFSLTLKPTPPTSSPSEVAQQVKINAGLASGSVGLRLHLFPAALNPSGRGSIGLDARVDAQGAFQRTRTTDPTSGQVVTSDFGIFSPEAVVGVWVRYFYLGYAFSRYWTFGGTIPPDLEGLINARNMHRFLLVVSTQVVDQATGQPKTFYLEPSYVADQDDLGHGTFVLSMGVSFTPL